MLGECMNEKCLKLPLKYYLLEIVFFFFFSTENEKFSDLLSKANFVNFKFCESTRNFLSFLLHKTFIKNIFAFVSDQELCLQFSAIFDLPSEITSGKVI